MLTNHWIETHLFTKTQNLNNRICLESWWYNRNYNAVLDELKEKTSFLAVNSSITERVYCFYHNTQQRICKMCDNTTTFKNFKTGYLVCCSIQCSTKDPDRSAKIVSNTDQIAKQETMKRTNLERYGVERVSKLFVSKSKQTKLLRYGSENYNNRAKRTETIQERYGVNWATQIPTKIEKTKRVRADRLPELRNREWLIDMNKTHTQAEIAVSLNVHPSAVAHWFKQHKIKTKPHSRAYNSKPQQEIYQYIKSLNIDATSNDRTVIYPKDLDIFIRSNNVGVELNGIYWHKEKPHQHLEKLELCLSKGIKLLQFWDSEWNDKQNICKSMISSALNLNNRIYARNTSIRELTVDEYRDFLNLNHIQGYAAATIKVGLFYSNELVACMGVSKSRYSKKYQYELIRSCTKTYLNIVGGFSKMLKYVLRNNEITTIVSYCDRRFFDGSSYENFGFRHLHNSKPNYFYWHPKHKSKSRMFFQKHHLHNRLETFEPSLTETENLHMNNWFRVFDCGNSVWVYEN